MNNQEGFITIAIKQAIKESGLPEEKIEEIASYMTTYLQTGAKYGSTPQGFFKWYTQDMGGKL